MLNKLDKLEKIFFYVIIFASVKHLRLSVNSDSGTVVQKNATHKSFMKAEPTQCYTQVVLKH